MSSLDARRRFDEAADTFDAACFVHDTTREGLLGRLEPIALHAGLVVDLGSATGSAGRLLARRFPGARVVAVDWSRRMLRQARRKKGWFSRIGYVQADATALPFADHSVDVVFSNLLLPWLDRPAAVVAEVSRVLRGNGLFAFSTLGPDSLAGLRHAPFADMHDVGDGLVRAGLRDPVLDVDRLTVSYESGESLQADLAAIGAAGCAPTTIGTTEITLELVYGHCWGSGQTSAGGEILIDARQIQRRDV